MSAAEIIEQIKALPQSDFQEVVKFIDEARKVSVSETEPSGGVRPGFREIAKQVFDRHDDLFRELAK